MLMNRETIKEAVKEKYGQAALNARTGKASCCGAGPARQDACDPITSNLYEIGQTSELPEAAVLAPLRGGKPNALAELEAGGTGRGRAPRRAGGRAWCA